MKPLFCPLCSSVEVFPFSEVAQRRYQKCPICSLIFVDPDQHLDSSTERARYQEHQNNPNDQRYRNFLQPVLTALQPKLKSGQYGLDFGSGPGPTLNLMFEEAGFSMKCYDPFFAPDFSLLSQKYDFITCTETAEHFSAPGKEFAQLAKMLRPKGWLAVMTQIYSEEYEFSTWYYIRDPSHVSFYQRRTFQWIAHNLKWCAEFPQQNVILLQKG